MRQDRQCHDWPMSCLILVQFGPPNSEMAEQNCLLQKTAENLLNYSVLNSVCLLMTNKWMMMMMNIGVARILSGVHFFPNL